MSAENEGRQHGGLETVQETLARLGVAGNADWTALVLFARNLVSAMDIFSEDQKADIQARIFAEMSRTPLDDRRFRRIVADIQDFLLETPKVADLRVQLKSERAGFRSLYDETNRVLAEIRKSTANRQDDIQRMGANTEAFISSAATKTEVLDRLREMITALVVQAHEEARTWEERARELERMANFDPLLSELYSRRALDAQLATAARRCARDDAPLSLLFLDVDNFKKINDTLGHVAGDGVLRAMAGIMSAHALQFGGFPARFGGEELVILAEGLTEAEAGTRAEEIREEVDRHAFAGRDKNGRPTPPLHVTVSIGVAQLRPGQKAVDLVLAADQAMYAAKLRGRNKVIASSTLPRPRTAD